MREDGFFIGSMVTLAELAESPIVLEQIPALGESARLVASPQIRNQGTVGGNLLQERRCHYFNQTESWRTNIPACFTLGGNVCHQIPSSKVCRAIYYSDLAPGLLAYDAAAEILTKGGSKPLSLQELIHSHTTGKNGKFILKGILIPRLPPGTWGKFLKAGVRSAIDFALGERVIADLNGRGLIDEAKKVEALLHQLSPSIPAMETRPSPVKTTTLPAYCPSCGAPVRLDEVEWLDENTSECAFCGSPIRS